MPEKLEANEAEIRDWMAALDKVGDRGSPAAAAILNHLDALTVNYARLRGLSEDDIARAKAWAEANAARKIEALKTLQRAYGAKFGEICSCLAISYGLDPDLGNLSEEIIDEAEALVDAGAETRGKPCFGNRAPQAEAKMQCLLAEYDEIHKRINDLHEAMNGPSPPDDA
jgi:hypothetical protein